MFGLYRRTQSYFQNTAMVATGKPEGEELALLEPFRGKMADGVFGDVPLPPKSDGSGQDRTLLGRAFKMLQEAGCKRDGSVLRLPDGQPFAIEFLDFSSALERHNAPYLKNLRLLGIDATFRVVDTAQYQSRTQTFEFDVVTQNYGGVYTPGESLRATFGSEEAKTPGSRNLTGIADPVVDALIEQALVADTRDKLTTACCARGTTGSRCGTCPPTGWPTGTSTAGPRRPPRPTPACCRPGGRTRPRPNA